MIELSQALSVCQPLDPTQRSIQTNQPDSSSLTSFNAPRSQALPQALPQDSPQFNIPVWQQNPGVVTGCEYPQLPAGNRLPGRSN